MKNKKILILSILIILILVGITSFVFLSKDKSQNEFIENEIEYEFKNDIYEDIDIEILENVKIGKIVELRIVGTKLNNENYEIIISEKDFEEDFVPQKELIFGTNECVDIQEKNDGIYSITNTCNGIELVNIKHYIVK